MVVKSVLCLPTITINPTTWLTFCKCLSFLFVDYMRTGTAFGIIAVTVMVIGHMFAFYALRRPRYIVKRLTALIHFMTGKT